jgi:hypothetical protein
VPYTYASLRLVTAGTNLEKDLCTPTMVVGPRRFLMEDSPLLTRHAVNRCQKRGITPAAVLAALEYGHHRAIRGADVYLIGWREVRFFFARGVDLARWEGVEVVCAHDGRVLTAYRNKHMRAMRDRPAARLAA